MKTLQTLTTFLLLFISLTATAQEKQSDATWKETLGFILKYKNEVKGIGYHWSRGYSYYNKTNDNLEFKMTDRWLAAYYEWYSYRCNINMSGGWIKLLSASSRGEYIELSFVDNVMNLRSEDWSSSYSNPPGNIQNYKRSEIRLWIPNSEMHPRLLTAFKHLAYLAKEKREFERKLSGDKF